ncbi:VOC family protein [Lysobacter sp. HA35]
MQLITYLAFDGNCREAFDFYRAALGGEIVFQMTLGQSPMAADMPADQHDRLMHIHLQIGDAALMGADGQVGCGSEISQGRGTSINVMADSAADAERIWAKLSEGADIRMPLEKTFWAERFGMLVDRYGKAWMINYMPPQG